MKRVLWGVAVRLSCVQDAWCIKVKRTVELYFYSTLHLRGLSFTFTVTEHGLQRLYVKKSNKPSTTLHDGITTERVHTQFEEQCNKQTHDSTAVEIWSSFIEFRLF